MPIYVEHGPSSYPLRSINVFTLRHTGLSEWYSPVKAGTGLHPRPSSAHALRDHFPHIDPSWASRWYPSRKGETVEVAHARSGGTLELVIPTLQRLHPDKNHRRVLLVAHAATVIALTRELAGDRELPMRVGCCSLTELRRKDGRLDVLGAWDVVKLADGSHLEKGAAREWGFEDIVIDEHGKVCSLLKVFMCALGGNCFLRL